MGCRISSEVKNRRREEMNVEQMDEYIDLSGTGTIPLLTAVPEPIPVPVPLPVPTPCNSNLTIAVVSCQERSSGSPTKTEIRYRKSKENANGSSTCSSNLANLHLSSGRRAGNNKDMVLIWGNLLRPVDGLVTASGNVVLRNLTHSLPCVVYYIKGPPCSRDA